MSRTGAEIKDSSEDLSDAPHYGVASLSINPHFNYFESQSKFIQDRISSVEKHFGQMCDSFSSYTRKTARLRDKGDELSKDLIALVDKETLNPSARQHYSEFAHDLSAIQDYRNAQVTRLEAKVMQPLSNYGLKCKHTKADLKAAFAAREKEQKIRKKLEVSRAKGDSRQIAQLETDLQKASVDASRTTKNLEQQMDKFELEKLQDTKKILSDFITVEMAFHAKALEKFSQCFQEISEVSIDQDIQEFRSKMRPANSAARMTMARSGSNSSLNSNNTTSYENTPRRDLYSTPTRRPAAGGVGKLEDDDDEDEEEDDDDEDEDDDDDDSYEDETELETERSEQAQVRQVRR